MIQPVKEKIILGIDPGTTIMGYGVLRVKGTKPEMIAMGIIDLRKFANHYLKLRHIHERVLLKVICLMSWLLKRLSSVKMYNRC